jgi:MATE family multidrug resistance protein
LSAQSLRRRDVFRMAWPIILANATVPLVGMVDTALIGNLGGVLDLGAIALATLIFNFLYWGCGFLRMGTTGFVAQARGAGDEAEVRAVLARALAIAFAIGLGLWLVRGPLGELSLSLLHGSPNVEAATLRFFELRLWGAPASLATLAVRGALIGLGLSRDLLLLELVLNGLNLALNLTFAGALRWGAPGIAVGTASAEWLSLAFSLSLILQRLRARKNDPEPFFPWARIRRGSALLALLRANGDIMLRTVLLLFGFAWFTDQSARFGDVVLAANHVLLQFVSFSAFFLDGYAFAAEMLIGSAIGARARGAFDDAVARSSELALGSALLLALSLWAIGPWAIDLLTDLPAVRAAARELVPYAAVYVLLAVGAFQLDGIFIGATRTRDMRNAAVLSTGTFVLAAHFLTRWDGNRGLWLSFLVFAVARALALALRYPALRRASSGGG